MSSRKEQKEALRREREAREAEARAAQQRKRLVGVGGAVLIAAIALVLIVVVAAGGGGEDGDVQGDGDTFPSGGSVAEQQVFDVQEAASAAGCELESNRARSRGHVGDINQDIQYPTNPPTSGRHYQVPATDGLYNGKPPTDIELVHSLEHGRVIIWAKPSLPREARQTIRAIWEADGGKFQTLVVRRANMPYAVAATAWNAAPEPLGTGRLLGCPQWNDDVPDALRSFMDEHRSNGPEPVP
jgi:Protein of unknown function (DUF3105)